MEPLLTAKQQNEGQLRERKGNWMKEWMEGIPHVTPVKFVTM